MKPIQDDERPRLLADENFNRPITNGLRLHYPDIDIITVQELQLQGIPDPILLRFAIRIDRILLTQDKNTIPGYFWEMLPQLGPDETSPGVWQVDYRTPIGEAIEVIASYWGGSRHEEWQNNVTWLV